jgi:hypothetical protein
VAAKILKFPRVPVPPPSKPMKTKRDEARVNKKVRDRREVEESK